MKIAPVFILLCSLLPFTVSSQLIPRTFDQNSQNPDNDKIVTTFGELIFKGNAKKLDKRLNKRFKQIDVDGNGEMSLDEYVYSTRSFQVDFIVSTLNRTNTDADRQQFLNRQPTEQEKNVYRQMDINKDGRVQLNEYINS